MENENIFESETQKIKYSDSRPSYHLGGTIEEILNYMHDGVYITDNNGITLFVNESYTKMSGIRKDDVIGKHMSELIKKGLFLESASLEVLKKKRSVSIIDCFKNGKKCLATSSPVFDRSGQIVMVVTNLRDMTELLDLKNRLEWSEVLNEKYFLELKELRKDQENKYNIIGNSRSMIKIYEIIDRIAEVDATILILGETGVGKEVVAREIHKNSLRKDGPFIKVNCASIPENLFESELFGYAKGAFTGAASKGKPGLFELADNGTILLDEIGELSLNAQSKLLRVLQEKQIIRVGGTELRKIDVRIIAATNKDLEKEVEKGFFREDLFYRLNVIPITVPPLRERREDIPLLSIHFLDLYNSKYNMNKKLSDSALELLKWYSWPGNVRQLKNLIERLVLISPHDTISDDYILNIAGKEDIDELYNLGQKGLTLDEAVSIVEKQLIYKALKKHGTTRKAAKVLGVSQPTIVRKTNKYGINLDKYK
ncbi:sigma-54 interaction domain-containing protein [Schnuerera ultunensis]|uniref:sigma-54 interaction domain-containing protein n=1 Tax=Schnuerera ultunensis TaxID=45497 RepID=UPI0003F6A702|nr:sigma 54-interacting transcriptional regulator [Schnuerera ultunensis]